MGRSSKLSPELQKKICTLLAKGSTDKDACAMVGIATSTFYKWLATGDHENATDDQAAYVAFSEAVSRARARANDRAIAAFRGGLMTSAIRETISEEFTETRLKKDGSEYEYKSTTTKTVLKKMPPDWRAGEAWLKRRDKANWSERYEHTGEDGEPIRHSVDIQSALNKIYGGSEGDDAIDGTNSPDAA